MIKNKIYDVIIIGGSYAGLSSALTLARSLRDVLVIDSGNPCNKQTPHSQNFLTQDGEKPSEIAKKAKEQILKYDTVTFIDAFAISGKKLENGFAIKTKEGETYTAKKLIFSTGIKDIFPEIKNFAECWGISVIHCPYCHGYEYRNKKTGIFANRDKAAHLTSLVHNLTKDITLLTNGKAVFTDEQLSKFKQHNIPIIEKEIKEIEHVNGYIKNVIFIDNTTLALEALYAAVPFVQHSDIPTSLGCELTEQGYIKTDQMQKTTVEGISACGDNYYPMRSVANAVASGNFAAAVINKELVDEEY